MKERNKLNTYYYNKDLDDLIRLSVMIDSINDESKDLLKNIIIYLILNLDVILFNEMNGFS